jgi:Skp family chaperone for outer membrane proteins
VKKAVVTAGIVLVLGVLWYIRPLSGQTPPNNTYSASAAPTAPPGTRVAILNLTYVIKNYLKYQHFQEEMKAIVEPYTKKHNELQQQLEELRKQAANLPRQGQSDQGAELERKARDIQRQMDDNKTEANLQLGKRSDAEMKTIYMDIYQATQGYAASHGYNLVLHYNDALTKEDFLSAPNIARKLQTPALMPLIMAPNLDISEDIVKLLNASMGSPNGTPQGTQPPAGGQR